MEKFTCALLEKILSLYSCSMHSCFGRNDILVQYFACDDNIILIDDVIIYIDFQGTVKTERSDR